MIVNSIEEIRKQYKTYKDDRYCVYKIISPSGLVYVGQTWKPRLRLRSHLSPNQCRNPYMMVELLKYGSEAMTIEIVEDHLTRRQSRKLERDIIKSLPFNKTMNIHYTDKLTITKL